MSLKVFGKPIFVADYPVSGIIYPYDLLLELCNQLEDKTIYGSFINVDSYKDKSKLAIACSNFRMENLVMVCDIEILDTPYGYTIQSTITEHPYNLKPIGDATVDEDNVVIAYTLKTISIKLTGGSHDSH